MDERVNMSWDYLMKKDPAAPEDPDQAELAYRLQNSPPGDFGLLERLVKRCTGDLYRWIAVLLVFRKKVDPTREQVLSLLKIAYATALRQLDHFHGNQSVADWLFSICIDVVQQQKIPPASNNQSIQFESEGERNHDLAPSDIESWGAFLQMDHRLAEPLLLRYLFELSLIDIAQILNIPDKRAHQRLVKARTLLLGDSQPSHRAGDIQAYLDGLLDDDPSGLERLNQHLVGCHLCQVSAMQLLDLEKSLSVKLMNRWTAPVLSDEEYRKFLFSIQSELAQPVLRRQWKLQFRQTAWIVGLTLLLAGFAFISLRLIPIDKQLTKSLPTAEDQLPPIIQMPSNAGASAISDTVSNAPIYIAPAFSNDGKWAVFAATSFSGNTPSLIFQTIEVYSRDGNNIHIISQSSTFTRPWVWWDMAPSISGDGRWIVYVSVMKEPHVTGVACSTSDHRDCLDLFLYDRFTGRTKRITHTVTGGAADGDSLAPTISADGQWIAFWSTADNLVQGFNQPCEQNGFTVACLYIYLYNVASGEISWLPIRSIPGYNTYGVDRISLSADARYVGFTVSTSAQAGMPALSSPLGLNIPGEATGSARIDTYIPVTLHPNDAIIYDRDTGKYELQNQTQAGVPGDGPSFSPVISADGRYVAFVALSTNLVPGIDSRFSNVYVRDRQTGEVDLISVSSGMSGNGNSGNAFTSMGDYSLNISPDGRYVVFESQAGNLALDPSQDCSTSNNQECNYLYVHDRQTGNTQLVSALTNQDFTLFPGFIAGGRWISFMQYFHNCSAAQSQCSNVMLYDLQGNRTTNLTKYNVDIPTLPWSNIGSLSLPWQAWETTGFALSPDGTQIAVGGYDSLVRIYQSSGYGSLVPNGAPTKILETAENVAFTSLVFSPSVQWLAGGTSNGDIYVWRLSDGKMIYSLQDQPNLITGMVFTQNGEQLVIATPNAVSIWTISGNQIDPVEGFSSSMAEALSVDISPDGKLVASTRADGTLWLQSLPSGKVIARLGTNWSSSRSLAFSSDASLLAIRSTEGTIDILKISENGDENSTITLVKSFRSLGYTGEMVFTPDNKYLMSSRTPGDITLWSIYDENVYSLVTPVTDGRLYSMAFGAGGSKFAALFESEVIFWEIPDANTSIYYDPAITDRVVDTNPQPEFTIPGFPNLYYGYGMYSDGFQDITKVASSLPFQLFVPTELPGDLTFELATESSNGVWLRYTNPSRNGTLYIYEEKSQDNVPKLVIGSSANVIQSQLGTKFGVASAEYIKGDWLYSPSFSLPMDYFLPVQTPVHEIWQWDNSRNSQRLRWQQNGIFIVFYYQDSTYSQVTGPLRSSREWIYLDPSLTREDLNHIASAMMPYSMVCMDNLCPPLIPAAASP